jgi:hypothetical protein
MHELEPAPGARRSSYCTCAAGIAALWNRPPRGE